MNANRLRPAVLALAAVALTAVLTGCQEDGSAGADAAPSKGATATPAPGTTAPGTTAPGKAAPKPGASTGAGATAGSSPGAAGGGKPGAKPAGGAATGAPAKECSDATPSPDDADPDEFAVYRVEKLPAGTGKVNLVIQHGAWGCPGKDSDGAPFVVTGEESRWALDQAAYVTATTPITDKTDNRRIGVQELIDWIDAHPDSGLVFRYETGDDGAIHRLEQTFTP